MGEEIMKHLQQEKYETEGGAPINAEAIDHLASYTYIADGFYNWMCSGCGLEHNDRWIAVSGRVHECSGCGKMNLLVRTDCTAIQDALQGKWQSEERDKELVRLRGIQQYNQDQLAQLRYKILGEVGKTIDLVLKHVVK
jgi:hypothetical protein